MRMEIVLNRRESMKGKTMNRRNSMKMEMVMDRRERMKGLELGVTHRKHKDHELCFMEASFRVQ